MQRTQPREKHHPICNNLWFGNCSNANAKFLSLMSRVVACWILASGPAFAADGVSALGRLEPRDGVRLISAPLTPESAYGAVVEKLLVKPGQDVPKGEVLAIMETMSIARGYYEEAEARLKRAMKQLVAARSAADEACVGASVAEREAERRKVLLEKGMAGEEEADLAEGRAETTAAACITAKAEAEVAQADAELAQVQVDLRKAIMARSEVRAPFAGRVLEVHAREGEIAAENGLLELGQVGQMYAIAEVYETDIGRVRVGQRATVSSEALDSVLTGTVEAIRQKVAKMDTIGTDPAARKDARIIEVEIRLDDSAAAASLTYLQVDIVISTD